MPILATLLFWAVLAPPGGEGLEAIRKEPDHVRRFEQALDLSEVQAKAARQLVKDAGSRSDLEKLLEDVTGGASLALESLRNTGKKPSKLGRQYKKGELKTREIERMLSDLALALGVEDRPLAEKARDHVSITHEEFLLGVMGGK